VLEVLEESEVWEELAAIVHHNCRLAVAELVAIARHNYRPGVAELVIDGSTTLNIAEVPRIGTVPLQTGLAVPRAGTHWRIVRPAPASSSAARGAIFRATAEAGQA
jgi:hypothetical protein